MKATELNDVLCSVPDAARPQFTLINGNWVLNHPTNETVEAAMIGTMTLWLIGEGYHDFEYELHDHHVSLTMFDIEVQEPLDGSGQIQTITKLLASACKAVKQ